MAVRIERVVTSGVFSLDGQDFDVENNVWLVGDDREVVVIDAAHEAQPILDAVAGRRVTAIVCTHAHNDHVNAAPALASATGAPVRLHPDDAELWAMTNGDLAVEPLDDGEVVDVAGGQLEVRHTPGHSPGGVCLRLAAAGTVFTGDSLFNGGPGATGRSFSDKPTLLHSIESRLFDLPPETVVRTGHGADTTIGAEKDRGLG
jgi:glyoxylase-like metal-dependent hydrolase (beta-lactamase superfamily II)